MTQPGDYYICETDTDGTNRYLVTMLPHDIVRKTGLPSEAIVGEFTNGPEDLSPDAFQQNPQFIEFLAFVIAKHATQCPGLIAETQRQQNGSVFILDRRTPTPQGAVPPEDIIGGMEISDGKMMRFHGSQKYRILTDDGFMQLDE